MQINIYALCGLPTHVPSVRGREDIVVTTDKKKSHKFILRYVVRCDNVKWNNDSLSVLTYRTEHDIHSKMFIIKRQALGIVISSNDSHLGEE
jgi:hypothetical protein